MCRRVKGTENDQRIITLFTKALKVDMDTNVLDFA